MFCAFERLGAHIFQRELVDRQVAMLQEEHDMNAVGDGLASEDHAHATRTRLQAETHFAPLTGSA
jgi:hypothetical protein